MTWQKVTVQQMIDWHRTVEPERRVVDSAPAAGFEIYGVRSDEPCSQILQQAVSLRGGAG